MALATGTAAAPWEAQLARAAKPPQAAKPLQAALAMGRPMRVALLASRVPAPLRQPPLAAPACASSSGVTRRSPEDSMFACVRNTTHTGRHKLAQCCFVTLAVPDVSSRAPHRWHLARWGPAVTRRRWCGSVWLCLLGVCVQPSQRAAPQAAECRRPCWHPSRWAPEVTPRRRCGSVNMRALGGNVQRSQWAALAWAQRCRRPCCWHPSRQAPACRDRSAVVRFCVYLYAWPAECNTLS